MSDVDAELLSEPLLLQGLFPPCVATAEVRLGQTDLDELHPEEATLLGSAVPARVAEFRAGRHCARAALSRLGVQGVPVLRRADRAPVWPAGVAGSITHTRRGAVGYCCAAVVRTSDLLGLGVDAESDEAFDRSLFERVMTARELASVRAAPEAEQGRLGKLHFSAKESVYKCQHPLSGVFLEFSDVEVTTLDVRTGRFQAVLGKDAAPFLRGFLFEGRFTRGNGILVTAVSLPVGSL